MDKKTTKEIKQYLKATFNADFSVAKRDRSDIWIEVYGGSEGYYDQVIVKLVEYLGVEMPQFRSGQVYLAHYVTVNHSARRYTGEFKPTYQSLEQYLDAEYEAAVKDHQELAALGVTYPRIQQEYFEFLERSVTRMRKKAFMKLKILQAIEERLDDSDWYDERTCMLKLEFQDEDARKLESVRVIPGRV